MRSGAVRADAPGWGPHARRGTPRDGRAALCRATAPRRCAGDRARPRGSSGGTWSPSSAGRGGGRPVAPLGRPSEALRELLDGLVDAGLVARGEGHEELLDDVGDLGQPDVVP